MRVVQRVPMYRHIMSIDFCDVENRKEKENVFKNLTNLNSHYTGQNYKNLFWLTGKNPTFLYAGVYCRQDNNLGETAF